VDGVRLRYHSALRPCRVESLDSDGGATLALEEPADAVAPGQVACLMDGDLVVGHGTIV
jgi:tRNA U34 2-thiouridine synthase MnmA/TrmU